MLNKTSKNKEGQEESKFADAKKVLEKARQSHEKYLLKFQREDLDDAIEYYIATIKLDPNVAETYYRLASLLWENGQISLSAAIEQCKSAVSISPKNPNARLYTGYFLNIAQQYDEAEKEYKEAIKINPLMAARPRLVLAKMLFQKMNETKPSVSELAKSLYYFFSGTLTLAWDLPSLKMFCKNFEEQFSILGFNACGKFLEKIKKFSMAIKTYDIAAEKTGRVELFYKKIGDISIQHEAPEIALDSYEKALAADPFNRDLLLKIATIIQTYFEDKADEAIDCYNRILELEGKNDRIYYELGHLYIVKNDYINAVNAFKLALESDNMNPFYHNSIAYSLVQTEQYDEAIEHYQIAININPDKEWTAIVCQALGALHFKIKNNAEAAIALFQTSLVLDSKCEDAHISIGDVYFEDNDMELAIKSYCDAISINPDNAKAYNKCAMALWEKDYLEEAIIAYNKAIALDPGYAISYNNLGVIYLDGIGNTDEALSLFEQAIKLNPNYTMAYFNLARSQQLLGDNVAAAENYQMALNLNKITKDIDETDIENRLFSLFDV